MFSLFGFSYVPAYTLLVLDGATRGDSGEPRYQHQRVPHVRNGLIRPSAKMRYHVLSGTKGYLGMSTFEQQRSYEPNSIFLIESPSRQ